MSYKVLARKWRPQHFNEMLGQESVLRALVNALDNNRLHHAYLFTGMRGVGKTTIARIFAKCLNCETNGVSASPCGECSSCKDIEAGRFFDLIEVDAASRTKVEETRELLENVPYAPTSGRYKVYLIDEVHMFSNHSFNALLKTLEEPPEHVKFLLATTDPQKVPVTVLSRCLQFNLRRMAPDLLADYLSGILDKEAIEHERPALDLIAKASEGSVRDSLSLVEQAAAFGEGVVRESDVENMLGRASIDRLLGLIESLGAGDLTQLFERVEQLAEYAPDFSELMGEILSLLHRIAMLQSVPGSVTDKSPGFDRIHQLAASLAGDELQLFYQIGTHARRDMPFAPDVREAFDMALLRMHSFRPQGSAPALLHNPASSQAAAANAPVTAAASQLDAAQLLKQNAKAAAQSTSQPAGQSTGQGATSSSGAADSRSAPVANSTPPATDQSASQAPSSQVKGGVSAASALRDAALAAARGETPESQPVSAKPISAAGGTAQEPAVAATPKSAPAPAANPAPQTSQKPEQAAQQGATEKAPEAAVAATGAPVASDVSGAAEGSATERGPTDRSPTERGPTDRSPTDRSPIDRDNVQQSDWHQIVSELDISGMPRQLASNTQWVSNKADQVLLHLDPSSEHLNTPRFAERVESALSTWFDRDVRLSIEMVEGELSTPARIDEQNTADNLAAARVSIGQDPVVRQLIDQVDGAVDEASIQPLNTDNT